MDYSTYVNKGILINFQCYYGMHVCAKYMCNVTHTHCHTLTHSHPHTLTPSQVSLRPAKASMKHGSSSSRTRSTPSPSPGATTSDPHNSPQQQQQQQQSSSHSPILPRTRDDSSDEEGPPHPGNRSELSHDSIYMHVSVMCYVVVHGFNPDFFAHS